MNLKFFILTILIGLLIGGSVTYYVLDKEYNTQLSNKQIIIDKFKNQIKTTNKRVENFCKGHDFGGVRMVEVICNGKQELCICGDPTVLKPVID